MFVSPHAAHVPSRNPATRVARARRLRALLESIEPRTLLSVVSVTADVADQGVNGDGSFDWVGNTAIRVGDAGSNQYEKNAIFPFGLPSIPAGHHIASADLSIYLESVSNASTITGGADLYGLGYRTSAAAQAGDYFEGAYNTDTTNAWALENNLMTNSTAVGAIATSAAGDITLASYLQDQYASGAAAGNYVFLRLNAQRDQLTSRFWSVSSANSATVARRPVLSITFEPDTLAAPTNLTVTTTGSSTLSLNWLDNSPNEDGFAIDRSSDGVNFSLAGSVGANVTAFSDSGLSPDSLHYYRVRAVTATLSSDPAAGQNRTLPTFAHTIWVDDSATGSSPDGSYANPYKTIAAGANVAFSGDGIVLRKGTYREKVNMPRSGVSLAPITLMGAPGERAIISGFEAISGWTLHAGNIYKTTLNWKPDTLFVGSTPQDLSHSPNEGWWNLQSVTRSGGVSTITDPAHLAGIPNLAGGWMQMHVAVSNVYAGVLIISHNTAAGTITISSPDGSAQASLSNTAKDYYIVKNKVELLDRAGEWAVVDNGNATYTLYFWPDSAGDLDLTQSRNLASQQIAVNARNYITLRNLEVAGNKGNGIDIIGNSANITVRDSVIHHNGAVGINTRYAANVNISNNSALSNGNNGISVSSASHVTIDQNEVAYNYVDGVIISGDISGKTPGQPGFVGTDDVWVTNNYIHHHQMFAHPDGIQTYKWASNLHFIENIVLASGQGMIMEDTSTVEIRNNVIWGSSAYLVIAKSTVSDLSLVGNTMGGSGYPGIYNILANGVDMRENIQFGGTVSTNATYTGDRNLYWNTSGPNILSAPVGGVTKYYTTVGAFTADTGQDANSIEADPLMNNVPTLHTSIETLLNCTTTTLSLRTVTGWAVGDHIEVNMDGIVRTITAVDSANKTITFDVPLPAKPISWAVVVDNWKATTNFNWDFRLAAGSPGVTLALNGGPVGAAMIFSDYRLGDFNSDGMRDLPDLATDILLSNPDPNNWVLPNF